MDQPEGGEAGYLCAVCAEKNGALASIWGPSWQGGQGLGRLFQAELAGCYARLAGLKLIQFAEGSGCYSD